MIMAFRVLVACWCLLVQHSLVASLDIQVQPTQIATGLTESLTVNCRFSLESSHDFSGLLSLILSKNDGKGNETQSFQDLVSFTALSGEQNILLSNLTANVSGHINVTGDSYATLQWMHPSDSETGFYRCQAHSIDKTGHPASSSVISQVTGYQEKLIEELRVLRDELSQQSKKLEQHKKVLIPHLFEKSEVFNGHYYLMSKLSISKATDAEAICEDFGGYLAEIESAAEYAFIKNFLNKAAFGADHAIVGAVKDAINGDWFHRFSKRPLNYVEWYSGEPDEPNDFCIVLFKPTKWAMHDNKCNRNPVDVRRQGLCEIPE